jgi:hypothetical protein
MPVAVEPVRSTRSTPVAGERRPGLALAGDHREHASGRPASRAMAELDHRQRRQLARLDDERVLSTRAPERRRRDQQRMVPRRSRYIPTGTRSVGEIRPSTGIVAP